MKTAIYTLYFESAQNLAEELQESMTHLENLIGALKASEREYPFDSDAAEEYRDFYETLDDAVGWLDNAIELVKHTYPKKEDAK